MTLLRALTACARRCTRHARVLAPLVLLVLMPAIAAAEMAWISYVTVPPSPFFGSTHSVVVRFYGEQGVFACESYCYEYDDRVDPGSFQLTVNGQSRASSMTVTQTNYSCNYGPYPGDWMCGWTYEAAGQPHLYFNGQTNTLRASVLSWALYDWYEIYTTHQYVTPPIVEIIAGKPATTVEKDACVAFGIIGDVASECGVLRLTHPLPAVRTFGKVRSPALIYYHDQVQLWAPLRLNILVPSGEIWPDSVQVRVTDPVTSAVLADKKVDGVDVAFQPGHPYRLGVALAIDANRATGVLPYRLTVLYKQWGAWQNRVTIDGELAILNRRSSAFGAGWWLAGLERLHSGLSGNRRLWVGGDGSTRVYVPTDSMNPRLFQAARVDRVDTLVWNAGTSTYTRYLPHGVRVEFDNLGRHVRTVNRLGHVTQFVYSGSEYVPQTLTVPGGLVYTFNSTAGAVSTISAPGAAGARVTTLRRDPDGMSLRAIVDPVVVAGRSDSVSFDFLSQGVVQGRTDRRGVRTAFTLEPGAPTLATASTPLTGGASVTHTFRSEQALTVGATAAAVHKDSAYTRYDGPRLPTDVADVSKIWLNGLGAPAKIADPFGKITTITYDTIWPGLASSVLRPNGFLTKATYDSRGNLATSVALNSYGDGRNDTTRYEWDPKWDFVTRTTTILTGSGGGQLDARFGYDLVTGNRIWEEPEAQTSRRINYHYYTAADGALSGLLKAVELPGGIRDSVHYDGLGNLALTKTPLGWKTWFSSDAIGRQTLVRTQLENNKERHDSTFYDVLGQVMRTAAYGPRRAVPGGDSSAVQGVVAESFYDAEGNLDSLKRYARPDTAEAGIITTRWLYDALGRRIAEIAPDGHRDSTFYDLAGNVDSVRNRRALKVRMRYDAANRLIRRDVPSVTYLARSGQGIAGVALRDWGLMSYPWFGTNPTTGLATEQDPGVNRDLVIKGDTAVFGYDDVGNMIRADNFDAHVRRTFFPNGRIKTDTLKVLSYHTRDSTKHVYPLAYFYGVGGFRKRIQLPRSLSPRPTTGVADTILFVNDERGGIREVFDPLGNRYELNRNDRYELTSINAVGAMTQMLRYDSDGRLSGDTISNYAPSQFSYPGQWLRQTRLTYVDGERVGASENVAGMQDTMRTWYTGLGHVARHEYRQRLQSAFGITNNYHSTENFSVDGLGNRYSQTDITNLTSSTGSRNVATTTPSVYEPDPGAPATGRLRFVVSTQGTDALEYDASGNLAFQYRIPPTPLLQPVTQEDQVSFFGADGLLRVAEQRKLARGTDGNEQNWHWWRTFEEYRYDALGRRVMVHARRRCSEAHPGGGQLHPCWMAMMRRTVWDGAQELIEVQRPGVHDYPVSVAEIEKDSAANMLDPSTFPTHFDPNPRFGVVIYTNALGLDRPLSVTRAQYVDRPSGYGFEEHQPYSLFPHWDWRGAASSGTVMDRRWNGTYGPHHGALKVCRGASESLPCHKPTWRLPSFAFGLSVNVTPYEWNGTLIEDKEDGTGRAYRRNRTMDPATGRFTQEDPIGLAGGLNVYGFGNGDPVNFSDPFGLASCPPDCPEFDASDALTVFGQLDALDSQINAEVATFLPRNIASAATGLGLGVLIKGAARITGALHQAATSTGNTSVIMGSEIEARIAGGLWTLSAGSRSIQAAHGAGRVVGRISADATRVYRAPQMKLTGPNAGKRAANLVRKDKYKNEVANTHLVIP